jgi:tripartite-type tricarboxylate transporter receptor subunit TctC
VHISKRHFIGLIPAIATLTFTSTALAEDWPNKPVTIVVGYPAGGDTDAAARLYAERLSTKFRKPFIVDNKPGGGGAIAASFVAKARPDGYTLLYTPSNFTIVPLVLKLAPSVAYDPRRDFTPIIKDQNIPLVMVTGNSTGFRSLNEFIRQAKSGKVQSYATPSTGSVMHVLAAMFDRAAGLNLTHVPYKGSAPVVADLLGGHIDVGWVTPGIITAHVQSGKLVALATGEAKRSSLLPNVPTLSESGYSDAKLSAWQGLLGPKGLPSVVVDRLNLAINEVLVLPDVVARLRALGMEPIGGPSGMLTAQIDADATLFGRLTKEFDIRAE